MRTLLYVCAVVMLFAASAFAQPRPAPAGQATPRPTPAATTTPAVAAAPVPATKIGFINTEAFGDEAVGIKRYVNAVKGVQAGFSARNQEVVNLRNRIKTLSDEITKLTGSTAPVAPETIQAKNDEGERLQLELKYKDESLRADFQKKYDEVVRPISAEIGKALDQYMLSHGLTMILDISKIAPAVLSANPATDVTRDFIAEYNSRNP